MSKTIQMLSNQLGPRVAKYVNGKFQDLDILKEGTTQLQNQMLDEIKTTNAKIAVLGTYDYALLTLPFPDTNNKGFNPIRLSNYTGTQRKALMKFDVTSLVGKKIRYAYLRLVNNYNDATNVTREVIVQKVLKNWDVNTATWNKYNATTAWEVAGAGGTSDVTNIATKSVYRTIQYNPSWNFDITNLVQEWADGGNNYGICLKCNDNDSNLLQLYHTTTLPNCSPVLVVVYSDDLDLPGFVTNQNKIQNMYSALKTRYIAGSWSWSSAQTKNAVAIMANFGYDGLYHLQTFFDNYIDTNGSFKNNAKAEVAYDISMGESLIDLYKSTNAAKYLTAITALRTAYNSLPKTSGGITMINTTQVMSEAFYCMHVFLAKYGYEFNDVASTDAAINQAILLYDKLQQSDGIPLQDLITMNSKGWGRGVGWLVVGIAKLLRFSTIKSHALYFDLVSRFIVVCEALKKYQQPNGMWYGVVHNPNTPYEISGTAMIATAFEIGVQEGVLDTSYIASVNNAIKALFTYSKTGHDISQCFPSNLDNNYFLQNYSTTEFGFGAWAELIANVSLRK